MSSEDMGLVPSQRLENGLNSHHHRHHFVFQDDEALRFGCGAPAAVSQRRVGGGGGADSGGVPKTRDLSGYIDERFFATPQPSAPDFRRSVYSGGERAEPRSWSGNGGAAGAAAETTPSVDGSEEEDEDDDEEDDDVDDDEEEANGNGNGNGNGSNSNNGSNGEDKIGSGKRKRHNINHHHHFGSSSRDLMVKESACIAPPPLAVVLAKGSPQQFAAYGNSQNVVTVAENDGGRDRYYAQYFHGAAEGSSAVVQKDLGLDNGCGFSGRKEGCSYSTESGESLRAILSDPVTGALMDDAMILPCGHSFGEGGIQHVVRMKSCYTCSNSVSEDSIAPNLSLRAAVLAFRREEELQFHRSAKRRRERFEQDKGVYGDSAGMELPRGRGVQFPFAVTDRVIIKGNKRTPERFVGREAVVTTQCLNGWYVVKTLDNAESVKLQYRSLAKVHEDPLVKPMSSKMAPNWL